MAHLYALARRIYADAAVGAEACAIAITHIWSQFGPSAVTVWPRCWRALGLRHGEAVRGKLQWPKSFMKRLATASRLSSCSRRAFGRALWRWRIAIAGPNSSLAI